MTKSRETSFVSSPEMEKGASDVSCYSRYLSSWIGKKACWKQTGGLHRGARPFLAGWPVHCLKFSRWSPGVPYSHAEKSQAWLTIKQRPARPQSRAPLRPWVTGELQSCPARFGWDPGRTSLWHLVGRGRKGLVWCYSKFLEEAEQECWPPPPGSFLCTSLPSPRQPYIESVEEATRKEWSERPCALESKKMMKCEMGEREKTLEANFIFTPRPQLII